jgi:hypothetical protein
MKGRRGLIVKDGSADSWMTALYFEILNLQVQYIVHYCILKTSAVIHPFNQA